MNLFVYSTVLESHQLSFIETKYLNKTKQKKKKKINEPPPPQKKNKNIKYNKIEVKKKPLGDLK